MARRPARAGAGAHRYRRDQCARADRGVPHGQPGRRLAGPGRCGGAARQLPAPHGDHKDRGTSLDEVLKAAADLGGHVVLKAESPGLVHKTDAGAVRLDLRTEAEIAGAYAELDAAFGPRLRRVLVQPMLAGGVETIAGVVQEPVFGPLVVFGLGGVATEVLGDHAARLAPLTDTDAADLIAGVRAAPLLFGHRGSPAVDTAALADLLLRVSRLADDLPEVAELDLNPVIATPDGAHIVDVRVRVARRAARPVPAPAQIAAAEAAPGGGGVITASLGGGGADLLAICRRYGMRLVGPNCFGVASTAAHLNATFAVGPPAPGIAGVVMQSGGVGIALLEHLRRLGIGVSSFASVGDKYDVSSNDMLTWWEQDEQTRLAVLYVESFGNPRGFARTARRVGRKLPVLTVIGGRSAAGQRAAASHTAASATSLVTQEALFGQAGIIATHSLGELIEAVAFLSCQPLPAGRRVAIVSNAGGAGVLAADACGDAGLTVATLAPATQRRLTELLPAGATVAGPVDASASVSVRAFRACLEVVAADDGVDAVLAIGVPTAVADLSAAILTARLDKPLAATLLDQPAAVSLLPAGPGSAADGIAESRIPVFSYPESAATALARAVRYREWRDSQSGQVPDFSDIDVAAARALIGAFLTASPDGGWLAEADAAALLASYQLPMVTTLIAESQNEVLAAAAELGGHVVLKAAAAGVVHKTDVGAVKLDLRTEAEIADAYAELTARFRRKPAPRTGPADARGRGGNHRRRRAGGGLRAARRVRARRRRHRGPRRPRRTASAAD